MLARTQSAGAVFAASSLLRFHRPWFLPPPLPILSLRSQGRSILRLRSEQVLRPLQYKSSTLCLLLSAPLARLGIAAPRATIFQNFRRLPRASLLPPRLPRRARRIPGSPALAPHRKRKAASQRNAFRARKQSRTAPAHLHAHGCGSRASLRCGARQARRTSKAVPARGSRRRPRPRALDSVFFRRAIREAGQSSHASIAAFSSPVNERSHRD